MSLYTYLQLQPVEPSDDGTVSDLDIYEQDETINLEEDIDEQELEQAWNAILEDDADDKIEFSKE